MWNRHRTREHRKSRENTQTRCATNTSNFARHTQGRAANNGARYSSLARVDGSIHDDDVIASHCVAFAQTGRKDRDFGGGLGEEGVWGRRGAAATAAVSDTFDRAWWWCIPL